MTHAIPEDRLRRLLDPFLSVGGSTPAELPENLYAKLSAYLDLLLRWNARTNLTAVREPEGIVTRHFGESIFAAIHLLPSVPTGAALLDFGSGAGFPGLPIQLALPNLRVTLAESQGKKAAFLREAVRVLELGTEVWPSRVEGMPKDRLFDVVALRAVDRMEDALAAAAARVGPGGTLVELGSQGAEASRMPASWEETGQEVPVPLSSRRVLRLWRLQPV